MLQVPKINACALSHVRERGRGNHAGKYDERPREPTLHHYCCTWHLRPLDGQCVLASLRSELEFDLVGIQFDYVSSEKRDKRQMNSLKAEATLQ